MVAARQIERIERGEHIDYLNYFDPHRAYKAFEDHVLGLPSSRRPEQHTYKVYTAGLKTFLLFMGRTLPTREGMLAYIRHLQERDLKASTIGSKYLSPVKIYLRALAGQYIERRRDGDPLTIHDRVAISEIRETLRGAAQVKPPKRETVSYMSPLYAHGTRLSLGDVNAIFDAIDIETLAGKRDLALLYVGFTSGLRLSELSRISMDRIRPGTDCYELRVIGKRGNTDPVPIDSDAVHLMQAWVEAYNAAVGESDPRRITDDTPIWQMVQHNDTPVPVGYQGRGDKQPISPGGLRLIVKKVVKEAIDVDITAHDMRRTVAALARANGMDYDEIRTLLRHQSIGTTEKYVGTPPQLSKSLVSNRVHFQLPMPGF